MRSGYAPSPAGGPEALLHLPPGRILPAFAMAAMLAMTLVVTGTVPHTGDLWQAAAPNPQFYLVGDSWPVLDSVASALLPGYAFAQTPPAGAFVTTWETTSANESIAIPAEGTCTIDWGDGITNSSVTCYQTHTYAVAGNHTIAISGGLDTIYTGFSPSNAVKLRSIDQWGDIEWTQMYRAFHAAANMVYNAADSPDLSDVNFMTSMFEGATSFNGDISGWDVSGVSHMRAMFRNAGAFDSDISGWDVSSVTNMNSMFFNAGAFNQPLGSWDVSSVTNMDEMFTGAASFRQNLGEWYVVLDDDTISGATETLAIRAQNSFLDGQNPTYGLGTGGDSDKFEIIGDSLG